MATRNPFRHRGEPHPHRCAAFGCDRRIPLELLMCNTHWRMVPADIRRRVWRAWKGGQGANSQEYVTLRQEAVKAVRARIEQRAELVARQQRGLFG